MRESVPCAELLDINIGVTAGLEITAQLPAQFFAVPVA
jgi:hypothetical protein